VFRHVVDILKSVFVAVVSRELASVQLDSKVNEASIATAVDRLVHIKAGVSLF
jgi:hypothetical protein